MTPPTVFPDVPWSFCPQPPDWKLDWDGAAQAFEWIRTMQGCPQDPVFHAEGDVFIHTRMVCEALAEAKTWRALPPNERAAVFTATLMHDIGKPACTKQEDRKITSRGHARRGALMTRREIWRRQSPHNSDTCQWREAVASLVRHHGLPLYFVNMENPARAAIEASQTARCDWLAILAIADVLGRKCEDQEGLLQRVELFGELAAENQCLDRRREFPSNHARFLYFRKPGQSPNYCPFFEPSMEVVMMSGLPGSGKNQWVSRNLPGRPVICLDDIRREMNVSPTDNQGAVVNCAKERARKLLREKQSFVWNATNLTSAMRRQLIDLFAGYGARIKIAYVETSHDDLFRRNRERSAKVPENALRKMIDKWEPPSLSEAHEVEWVCT